MNLPLFMLMLLPAADPVFTAHIGGATQPRGTLTKLEADWSITLGGAKPTRIAGSDLISLRQVDGLLPPRPAGPHVRFANGDVLAGDAVSLSNDRVRFDTPSEELTLPLTALAALWLAAPADRAAVERQLAEPRNRDIVWLKNGDVQEGTVLKLDAAALTLDVAGKTVKVDRPKLAVIGLNTELARLPRPKQLHARLTLADGGRVSLQSAQLEDMTLIGKSLYGGVIRVPVDHVVAIDVVGGRAVDLSDLKPAGYAETPYFKDSRWNYRVDRAVTGGPLRLAGQTYDKGIGMHSASRLSFPLDGRYRRFECVVGLDEISGAQGRARIQVLVDGKPQDLGWDGDLQPGMNHTLAVPVSAAKELTLVVEFGADGLDVQDHVNWAAARLLR